VAAASLFAVMPAVIVQVGMVYNDLAATAMFLAGLHLAGRAADSLLAGRSWLAYGLLAGTALGFTAGVKPGFVLGGVATLLVVVVAAWQRTRGWRRPLAVLATFAAPIVLLGAPFYLRNVVRFGNPLAPFTFHLGPITLPGNLDLVTTMILPSTPPDTRHLGPLITPAIWFGYDVSVPYLRVENNFGLHWPWLLLPALAGWVVLLILRKRTWYYATVLLPIAGVFFSHPTPWIFRYVLFIAAPAAVALCLGLRWLASRPHRAGLVAATALSLVALWSIYLTLPIYRYARTGHPGITAVRILGPTQLIHEVIDGKSLQIFDQPGATWVRDLPDGTRIGVADQARAFPTPLYGERAQHRVVRMSPPVEDNDAELARSGIGYLFLIEGDPTAEWVQKQPARFTLVSRTNDLMAYRVVSGQHSRTD
jgi:4-amino-4-deoxy-L-arabinose transferase-like glycosyltransferase